MSNCYNGYMVNYNNKYNVSDLPGAPFDWVLSVEVGEHIPVDGQNNFIGNSSGIFEMQANLF